MIRPRGVRPIRPRILAAIMNDPLAVGLSAYRGADTSCPGCGRNQWLVGRVTAECAFCGSALPLAGPA